MRTTNGPSRRPARPDDTSGRARLGQLLRELRQRAGMTQEQLAGLSTISVRAIRDLEQGRVAAPRQDTIRLLTDALRTGPATRAQLEQAARAEETASDMPPVILSSSASRVHEISNSVELLATGATRMLQLTGLPGVGKTATAQHVAATLRDAHDVGVVWADLSDTSRLYGEPPAPGPRPPVAELVVSAARDGDLSVVAGELVDEIADRRMLLVLDGDDPDRSAVRVAEELPQLLVACPELVTMVTARGGGTVPGAAHMALAGLPAEPGSDTGPAMRLMTTAVRCACPELAVDSGTRDTLAGICRSLDGVPYALEQAAQWLPVTSPGRIQEAAADDPLALVGDLYTEELRAALPPCDSYQGRALEALCALGSDATLREVAATLEAPLPEAVRTLRALLRRGLVRRVPAADDDRFTVLNLVRHALTVAGPHHDGHRVAGSTAKDG
ncbi:helix-turn-helix domain-containing protein [Streptomyces sp. NPDC090306]|uniref:helix-turn-helix domain-containing protein n=1 Tax=Streptomyces sp. NPDC090306 TaxID=3365961 RepID=UPI00381C4E4B